MHLKFRNVNDAFRGIVQGLHDGSIPTVRTSSRNGNVLQVDEPVLVTYERPRERVLFNTVRDCNPWFHLYEALWMLAGRNDVASVAHYAKNMASFSDDGKTLNGSYGERWRRRFGFDQLVVIEKHLKDSPHSRRAVLQMWGPEHDLLKMKESKDVCCLAWDTVFRSPEGETTVKELARRFQLNSEYRHPVYTVDPTTGLQDFGWMTNAWKVGVKKVLRVGLDDGSFLRLTPDHVVYRKTSLGRPAPGRKSSGFRVDECQAGDLSVGDRLLAELSADAKCRRDRDGRRMFKISLADDTRKTNMAAEHREYWKFAVNPDLRDDYDVHHRNEDKTDNRLSNLEEVPHGEHQRRHKIADPSWGKYTPNRGTDGRFNRVDNHKVVSIEDGGFCEVYDFTVPGRHNAVLSNGVLVHNCNLSVMFSLRENRTLHLDQIHPNPDGLGYVTSKKDYVLDMTVTNRSNDMVWGMLGANYVHFTILQEYMAARLGAEVGRYHHFTNNLHVYETRGDWMPADLLDDRQRDWYSYEGGVIRQSGKPMSDAIIPLVRDPAAFERELPLFVGAFNGEEEPWACVPRWDEPFFQTVAGPMLTAVRQYKHGLPRDAMNWVDRIAADDWRIAAEGWLKRRAVKCPPR